MPYRNNELKANAISNIGKYCEVYIHGKMKKLTFALDSLLYHNSKVCALAKEYIQLIHTFELTHTHIHTHVYC